MDAYASQYAFLEGLAPDRESTHFENDAEGYPRRHITLTAHTYGTYEVNSTTSPSYSHSFAWLV